MNKNQLIIEKDIIEIIKQSEQMEIEFKSNFKHLDDEIIPTMVAFANQKGGKILIGIQEITNVDGNQSGKINGFIGSVDRDGKKLENKIKEKVRPNIFYNFHNFDFIDNKFSKEIFLNNIKKGMIYVIDVKEANEKPVCIYHKKGNKREFIIRGIKGNEPVEPSKMREIIFDIRYEFESLKDEFEYHHKNILEIMNKHFKKYKDGHIYFQDFKQILLNEFATINLDLFLSKSYLRKYIDFERLKIIRNDLRQLNLLFDVLRMEYSLKGLYDKLLPNVNFKEYMNRKHHGIWILFHRLSLDIKYILDEINNYIEKINQE